MVSGLDYWSWWSSRLGFRSHANSCPHQQWCRIYSIFFPVCLYLCFILSLHLDLPGRLIAFLMKILLSFFDVFQKHCLLFNTNRKRMERHHHYILWRMILYWQILPSYCALSCCSFSSTSLSQSLLHAAYFSVSWANLSSNALLFSRITSCSCLRACSKINHP